MQKGQGALEYLMLIGGAVIVTIIVVTLLLNIANEGTANTQATSTAASDLLQDKRDEVFGSGGGGFGNLTTNAGFEDPVIIASPNDNFPEWVESGTAGTSSLKLFTTGCHSGSQCVQFITDSSNNYRGLKPNSGTRPSVESNETYEATIWIKSTVGTEDLFFRLRGQLSGVNRLILRGSTEHWNGGTGNGWSGNTLDFTTNSWGNYSPGPTTPVYINNFPTTWTKFTIRFNTNTDVDIVWLEISRSSGNSTWYLDDVEIKKI